MLFISGFTIVLYVVHCVAYGSLKIIPEIFLKLNCIKEKKDIFWIEEPIKAGKREDGRFVLLENEPAVINIQICEHAKYPADLLRGSPDVQETIFYSIRSPKGTMQWCFKFQIPKIVDSMRRTWQLDSNTAVKLKIHIRPSKSVPIVLSEETSLTTQISSYSITEFDAFGCLVYNENEFLNLTCKSAEKYNGFFTMYWKASGIAYTHSLTMPYSRIKAHYINQVKLEDDGAYLDCIEDLDKDYINVRIFLIHNKTEMTSNNSSLSGASLTYKPISSDDREGCLEYVNNYLHNPKSEKFTIHSTERILPNNGNDVAKWIVIFGVALILLLLIAFGFFIKKIYDWIHNKKKTDSGTNNLERRPSAEHVYCYIERGRRGFQVELPKSTRTDNTGAVVENQEQTLREIANATEANPTTSPYIANQENDELIYTYAYADRFCIMEALRMQNQ